MGKFDENSSFSAWKLIKGKGKIKINENQSLRNENSLEKLENFQF